MTALPSWANTPLGRELVAAILADPPEGRLIRDDWGARDHRSFAGKVAGRLRRLHKEWVERKYSHLNREFAISHVWNAAEAERILRMEDANALIERVLAEAVDQRAAA